MYSARVRRQVVRHPSPGMGEGAVIFYTGNDPKDGPIAYASSIEEAEAVVKENPGAEHEINHDVHIDDFRANYWFPQDWPGETVYSIFAAEYEW